MKNFRKILIISIIWAFFAGSLFAEENKNAAKSTSGSSTFKSLAAPCARGNTITYLSFNNVNTPIHLTGTLWTDPDGQSGYEIPKGSGLTSLYAGGIWIAGTDVNEQLKVAAVTFNSTAQRNYWPGPLIIDGPQRGTTDAEVCYQYDQHWEISRYQVSDFRDWYRASAEEKARDWEGYAIPSIILDWPAHGDAAAGYSWNMAPWFDNNEDGMYNPGDGDYPFYDLDGALPCGTTRELRLPRLYGDATVWWVYNDRGDVHNNPDSEPIGFEIRAQAFEFSTNDALNDMSFYNYELINRSTYTLLDTYFGVYADGDLGYAYDDYVGCHVQKGIGYFYNGESVDGTGQTWAYGADPPAIGLDFFEGPYQDDDGQDNGSSYDEQRNLVCDGNILNGNINGLNFGDGLPDNERWGMRRFVYYSNGGSSWGSDPGDPFHFYNYLKGYWKDNEIMRYGGRAHPSDESATNVPTDFMFPDDSDPCGWGQGGIPMPIWNEVTAGNAPADRRLVQSSGPFVLEPGAVNDITVGAVWARSYAGGMLASVRKMLNSDELAQRLFENCFQVVDGPDAPELSIIEMDKELIFHVWNKPSSNNYMEAYNVRDPFILCPPEVPDCDTYYSFQGYMIYQLKDHTVSITAASEHNTELARLVYQCDIQDGVSQLVNFYWDEELGANIPVQEVYGNNNGIEHSFVITQDAFAEREKTLINHKKYYYVAIAYAHNAFMPYDQNDVDTYSGQRKPFLSGRKGVGGGIKTYEVVPHIVTPEEGGTVIQGSYGDAPAITQVEGHGSGRNIINLSQETVDEIMSGPPWRANEVTYEPGFGPISVHVIEPMNVPNDTFIVKMDSVNSFVGSKMNGKVINADWYIVRESTNDTVRSEAFIKTNYDQLILEWGLSINITQEEMPFKPGANNNGYLTSSIEFEDRTQEWLSFLKDTDRLYSQFPANWIRSGYFPGDYGDKDGIYENVLLGTWAPFQLTSKDNHGPGYDKAVNAIDTKYQRFASVDLVITSDRSKWTRSPVIEMCYEPDLTIGKVEKFTLRASPSIDQYGRAEYPDDPDSIGMGWFPGYAIDIETGERLNIMYGESSWLKGDNGGDMIWNPSSREGSALYHRANGNISAANGGQVYFGGKHYIYIMGHNRVKSGTKDKTFMPAYDEGKFIYEKMLDTRNRFALKEIFVNAMWTGIPMLDSRFYDDSDVATDPYGFIKNDVTIKLRVTSQYSVDVWDWAKPDSVLEDPSYAGNMNRPMYKFNTEDIYTMRNDLETGKEALDLIRVVPNPYYGYSLYERTQIDNIIKITNLPQRCQISIYALNGTLVRRFGKDNDITSLEWNLKNQYGIPISGGVYIIHVNAYELGEKIVKFMGILRPIDLTSF
ncbi:T9SS C-terminal target domain-containing protein [Bacteroidota bacterium]